MRLPKKIRGGGGGGTRHQTQLVATTRAPAHSAVRCSEGSAAFGPGPALRGCWVFVQKGFSNLAGLAPGISQIRAQLDPPQVKKKNTRADLERQETLSQPAHPPVDQPTSPHLEYPLSPPLHSSRAMRCISPEVRRPSPVGLLFFFGGFPTFSLRFGVCPLLFGFRVCPTNIFF